MDAFVAWNARLLESFFSRASQGEETWLAVDSDELDTIGRDLGGDAGFVQAVRAGPPWGSVERFSFFVQGNQTDFLQRALGLLRQRILPRLRPAGYVDPGEILPEYRDCRAPTYLPFLAALVRASARQDADGFYRSFRVEMGVPDNWHSQELERFGNVWEDLQRWSNGETHGRFGIWKLRRLGSHAHVGVPLSQCLISRRDADRLPRVFARAGVMPGQKVTDLLLAQIVDLLKDDASRALQQAIDDPDLRAALFDRLRPIVEDWDGTVQETDAQRGQERQEIKVALALSAGNSTPWEIRWAVPAIRDEGSLDIEYGGTTSSVTLVGTEFAVTDSGSVGTRAALAESAQSDVTMVARWHNPGPDTRSSKALSLVLAHRPMRYLTWQEPHETGAPSQLLVERNLPANGNVYMLCGATAAANLKRLCFAAGVSLDDCPRDGLPDGWSLFFLRESNDLARGGLLEELPDGSESRGKPRALRLVGGRAIRRAGLRQYLSYDLPVVELDAPPGSEIRADGLNLSEVTGTAVTIGFAGLIARPTSRRFAISLSDPNLRSFVLTANHAGRPLGSCRLRIAPDEGLVSEVDEEFGLDSRGYPTTSGVRLSGADLTGGEPAVPGELVRAHVPASGNPEALQGALEKAAVSFLDSLSQFGVLNYGVARDQVRRVSARKGVAEPDAHSILRTLRSRGFLEIESDARGRWARIRAVRPQIYTLPVRDPSGARLAAVAGSLRLGHWRSLADLPAGLSLHVDTAASELPVAFIRWTDIEQLESFAAEAGFVIVFEPARRIACWASNLEVVRNSLMQQGVEDALGQDVTGLERYQAGNGTFVDVAAGQRTFLTEGPLCQLFRLDDPDTGRHRLHLLGFTDGQGIRRFAFVRDPRWGIWAALGSFADWYAQYDDGASPWPFQYSRDGSTLWLPARIGVPVVLERALVLCSGAQPTAKELYGDQKGDSIVGYDRNIGRVIGKFNRVYSDFVPPRPNWATWLGYRWVPEDVARAVAERLGGRLEFI